MALVHVANPQLAFAEVVKRLGSTRVGDCVVMAGQVGVEGHPTIGSKITVYAKSGITKDLFEPGIYTGFPAKPLGEGRRMMTYPGKVCRKSSNDFASWRHA